MVIADSAQSNLEREFVSIFSDLAEIFGNPRSHGAIYGLLFASETPLSMDEITRQLNISKGSASQGLRQLEKLGAVYRERDAGERSHHYAARLELKPLVAGFLSKQLLPKLSNGASRLQRLEQYVPELPPSSQPGARLRLQRISKWHKRAASLLPVAQKLLQGD